MDGRSDLHAINVALQWLTEMQPEEGKTFVSNTCKAVRMLLDVCSARQQSAQAQAQCPPPIPPALRATGPVLSSADDAAGAMGHNVPIYFDTGAYTGPMVIVMIPFGQFHADSILDDRRCKL